MPFTFEQIEAARDSLGKEYKFIDSLSKNYRMHIDDLPLYVSAIDRIRQLNSIIRS